MNRNAAQAYSFIPYLIIWGVQWMTDSLLQYMWKWDPDGLFRTVLAWTALAATALIFAARSRRGSANRAAVDGGGEGTSARSAARGVWLPAAIAAVLLAIAVPVAWADVMPLYFAELFRAFVLALFYVAAGFALGRELVYLGAWLLVLTAVIGYGYLGYAPIVLGFSGGASLVACAVIIRLWNRTFPRRADKSEPA
ncbi:hypothetical protein [Paenibacillus flagellatus]|uniref:Uncharacterized protein n=1 Tax=Paenibacillus flagellatus TaxID=2211139 RepID=A0A2V5JVE0_9BACL|nr:hypothetical protein [Paenibacillus flagellatus]PYI50695.1 hypothetical protein DLM86_28410 [Paenibacillus flagellatus]